VISYEVPKTAMAGHEIYRQVGEIVTAMVLNPIQNPETTGKPRPVVLVAKRKLPGGWWDCMGMTTNPVYKNGRIRVAVPNPSAVGLDKQGYLWGPRLVGVPEGDLGYPIGWVDLALAEAIIDLAQLGPDDAAALRKAQAWAHHGIVQ
jgi:hypothetical protein